MEQDAYTMAVMQQLQDTLPPVYPNYLVEPGSNYRYVVIFMYVTISILHDTFMKAGRAHKNASIILLGYDDSGVDNVLCC